DILNCDVRSKVQAPADKCLKEDILAAPTRLHALNKIKECRLASYVRRRRDIREVARVDGEGPEADVPVPVRRRPVREDSLAGLGDPNLGQFRNRQRLTQRCQILDRVLYGGLRRASRRLQVLFERLRK